MKTRGSSFATKLIASVVAGSLSFASVPVSPAWAQAKPPATKPGTTTAAPAKPAAPKPAAPAAPAAPKGPTPAQLKEAKKHYDEGDAKYKAGDYATALREFEAADAIKSTPQTARFIGLCHDGLGHYQEAITWYEKYLAEPPKNPNATQQAQLDEAKARVAKIKTLPGKVHIESNPPGASVLVDGQAHTQPTPTDVEVPPGKHVIKLTMDGREPKEKEIEVAFASKQDVTAELEAKPAPPAPPPVAVTPPPAPTTPPPPAAPPPEPRSKVPAYVTGGLAVVAAGIGTVFGVMALGDKSDFDKEPNNSPRKKEIADDGDNHALIADMAFAAALTLGITSVVLFLTKDETPPATAALKNRNVAAPKKSTITLTPTPIITPTGGGAGAILRF